MLTLHDRLRPSEDEVAAKLIDGEAIIINLATGIYYSMDRVGGLIWELIEKTHSLEEIVQTIVGRFETTREQVEGDVLRLAEELFQENLVKRAETEVLPSGNIAANSGQKEAYEPPKLNIHREMGDLLALDPPTPGLYSLPWREPDGETPQ
jgi:hypothetical protein